MENMNWFIALIPAILACFFGYKLKKVCITLAAFVIGFYLGAFLGDIFHVEGMVRFILEIVLGIVVGFIGYKFYLLGIFILCFLAVATLCKAHIDNEILRWVIMIVGGSIVGILGIKFVKPITIITTAISGGTTIINSVLVTFTQLDGTLMLAMEIIIIVVGILFQFKTNRENTESQ